MPTKTRALDLGMLNRTKTSRVAFGILHAVQDEPLEYMAASLGLVLETICREKNLSPQDIMTVANNMLRTNGLEDDNYVTALRSFVRDELPA